MSWVAEAVLVTGLAASAAAGMPGSPGAVDRGWRISAWGGRITAAPPSLAAELQKAGATAAAAFKAASGGTASAVYDGPAGAFDAGLEAGRALDEDRSLGIGVRAGLMLPGASTETMEGAGTAGGRERLAFEVTPRMYPFLIGAWSEGGDPRGFRFRGSCFLGRSYLRAGYTRDERVTAPTGEITTRRGTASWEGWTPITAEFSAEASVPLGGALALSAQAGIRLAEFTKLTYAGDADTDGDGARDVRQGDALKGSDGKDFGMDFGGTFLRAGLKLSL